MWSKRKEIDWGRKSKRTTYCCSIHKEWVEFYEEASAFFGAGLLVHVSVEITELTEGRRQKELYNTVNVQLLISFSILVQDYLWKNMKNTHYLIRNQAFFRSVKGFHKDRSMVPFNLHQILIGIIYLYICQWKRMDLGLSITDRIGMKVLGAD